MSKFLKIAVLKTVQSEIFAEVPDWFDMADIRDINSIDISRACRETLIGSDWDSYSDEYDWDSVSEVDKGEAESYRVFDATNIRGDNKTIAIDFSKLAKK